MTKLMLCLKSHSSSIKTLVKNIVCISDTIVVTMCGDSLARYLLSFDVPWHVLSVQMPFHLDGSSFTYDSTPNFVDDSPNVFNPPPQPPTYSYEICGNDAHYGHDCPPQVPFIYNPEPCYNQDFNFPQNSQSFQQQYLCCENCGGPHETYQCQPMNEDYYHEQNSCYDPNSFGFDQFQPPQYTVNHPIFNAQNELLNSQNEIMEQMTSICDMVGQYMQKKEEDKRIAEDQAAKDRYWKIPICYDVSMTRNSSITLVDIFYFGTSSCLKGISNSMCDVPFCDNSTPLEVLKWYIMRILSIQMLLFIRVMTIPLYGVDIDYVKASPPDSELCQLSRIARILKPLVLAVFVLRSLELHLGNPIS
ncbi:hypothetical protein Tco_0629917 [Tanacetum coccineum]|uniref:Uncharacterized protein n=1 Tax=Tanacetum coccineum TaxID=301880 RepID=A0ABQ4WUM3_9ASTR